MPSGKTAENKDTGSRPQIEHAGYYHLMITAFDSEPRKEKTQERIDGWKVSWEVCDGTARTEDGKACIYAGRGFERIFWNQKPASSGKMNQERQTRLLIATGVIAPDAEEFNFEDDEMIGLQLIVHYELNTYDKTKNGKTTRVTEMDIHFKDMWHVDDPDASHYPRSAKHLEIIPPNRRWKPQKLAEAQAAATSEPVTPPVSLGKL